MNKRENNGIWEFDSICNKCIEKFKKDKKRYFINCNKCNRLAEKNKKTSEYLMKKISKYKNFKEVLNKWKKIFNNKEIIKIFPALKKEDIDENLQYFIFVLRDIQCGVWFKKIRKIEQNKFDKDPISSKGMKK